MSSTNGLTGTATEMYSMDEKWLWYLSGAVDSHGRLSVSVKEVDSMAIGFQAIPRITFRIQESDSQEMVFGMLDEYAEENAVQYRIDEIPHSSTSSFTVEKPNSIEQFLEPIMGGFILQKERAEIMVDEIIPKLEDGQPDTKEEFVELMEIVDRLREKPVRSERSSKFSAEYFKNEWELSA
jgi:hypothetical protein